MRRHSFLWKLFVGNMLMMGLILFVAAFFSYKYLNANYQQESQDNQDRLAKIAKLYFQNTWPQPTEKIDSECKQLFANLPIRLTVIADDGRVLGDSKADPVTMENHKTEDRSEIISALRGEPGRAIRASETLGIKFRYFTEPIEKDGKVVGAVRVAMPIRAIAEGRNIIRNALLWAALAAVGVAIIIAWMLSWIWHKPIRRIMETAREIAAGNLATKAYVRGNDELAQLAAALNEMRESLASQIKTITTQREHLSVIVRNLREGVIALDRKGHIILLNSAAVSLLAIDSEDATGLPLQSAVRLPDLLDLFQQVCETNKPANKQIEIETNHGLRILDLHAADFATSSPDGIEILLVIRDITEIARAAKMKADFVANASHELRTPLATIRAAVDSMALLESDDKEALAKFTDMLNRHVARLEDMTKDLLDLNIAETTGRPLNIVEIDITGLGEWATNHFARSAQEKKVKLKVTTQHQDSTFQSDMTWIKLILQNLIDNAIKFTPPEGLVECEMKLQDEGLLIRVADTGCGIPADIRDKVFERFFQAESSRAGDSKIRGTGLGLAIVKHATERLGGTINLESSPGNGTVIAVNIPKPPNKTPVR